MNGAASPGKRDCAPRCRPQRARARSCTRRPSRARAKKKMTSNMLATLCVPNSPTTPLSMRSVNAYEHSRLMTLGCSRLNVSSCIKRLNTSSTAASSALLCLLLLLLSKLSVRELPREFVALVGVMFCCCCCCLLFVLPPLLLLLLPLLYACCCICWSSDEPEGTQRRLPVAAIARRCDNNVAVVTGS